jgi:hypothetical protein
MQDTLELNDIGQSAEVQPPNSIPYAGPPEFDPTRACQMAPIYGVPPQYPFQGTQLGYTFASGNVQEGSLIP